MYLQTLEILGFKSFAKKTRLVFEPGITAIVGPNGCGKSNVSDAIRWVLGEQRPTALRGAAMTDVIFNGTDEHKPLGMAEVSITFVDCEKQLGLEYNEVTITRRVFRTGEGQYFLNKTPCRLRDIQRLFMDTGIGTSSYSVMAQGQIDAILSSRPEDRRAIFEEASGITRFRADRKEAFRKLEATDQNLARLNDVLQELRRQIGSLQRQAARARRYKEMKAELRTYDLFLTRARAQSLDVRDKELNAAFEALRKTVEGKRQTLLAQEERIAEMRRRLDESEKEISEAVAAATAAHHARSQAEESIRQNNLRCEENLSWRTRDEQEILQLQTVQKQQQDQLAQSLQAATDATAEAEVAEKHLEEVRLQFESLRAKTDESRSSLQKLRDESLSAERTLAQAQAELARTEASVRETLLANEHLTAEQERLTKLEAELSERLDEVGGELETLQEMADRQQENVQTLETRLRNGQSALSEAQSNQAEIRAALAACRARLRVLEDAAKTSDGMPEGTALLLNKAQPLPGSIPEDAVLGLVADQFSAEKEYRIALRAVLSNMRDTIAVRRSGDLKTLRSVLHEHPKNGSNPLPADLIAGDAAGLSPRPSASGVVVNAVPFLPLLSCKDDFRPAAELLLSNVYLVDQLPDCPADIPAGITFVTRSGTILRAGGRLTIFSARETATDPFARHAMLEDAQKEESVLLERLQEAEDAETQEWEALRSAEDALSQARVLFEQSQRTAARKEGEERSLAHTLAETRANLKQTIRQLEQFRNSSGLATDRTKELTARIAELSQSRTALAEAIAGQSEATRADEAAFLQAQGRLTDARLAHVSVRQRVDAATFQNKAASARLKELNGMIDMRQSRLRSYDETISRLKAENETATAGLDKLDEVARCADTQIATLREARLAQQNETEKASHALQEQRASLDVILSEQNKTEVALAETKLQRENLGERLRTDWDMALEELAREPLPDWNGKPEPTLDACAEKVRDLRRKMDEMGPVNLIAIEDCQKSEERLAFLSAQEEDLLDAKEKLLALMKDIDRQSVARFQDTFKKANENFQKMYTRLFGGGKAELRLLDDSNVLECGIDIVARPPGKKPQTISLLSGGERTMTAVALLFSIYAIKPSPFAILDELDAALDDSNIGRFVDVLKDFLNLSQFLIITHNQHTIAGADIVYGVTQQEKGVSTILSMRLKRVGIEAPKEEILPEADTPPPPSERKLQNAMRGKRHAAKKEASSQTQPSLQPEEEPDA
ncbi:MAG: chromosome segregation protein SMC [Kiritimatiellia bacterium]